MEEENIKNDVLTMLGRLGYDADLERFVDMAFLGDERTNANWFAGSFRRMSDGIFIVIGDYSFKLFRDSTSHTDKLYVWLGSGTTGSDRAILLKSRSYNVKRNPNIYGGMDGRNASFEPNGYTPSSERDVKNNVLTMLGRMGYDADLERFLDTAFTYNAASSSYDPLVIGEYTFIRIRDMSRTINLYVYETANGFGRSILLKTWNDY